MKSSDYIAIGALARRAGLAVSAVRHYESLGLVRALRSAGGQRQFRRADIRRLAFVRVAQQFGYSLPEIAAMMADLPQGRTPTKRDWERLSRAFRSRITRRIGELETLRDNLDGCIGCGCLSLKKCRLYNSGDRAARLGPGPRYLMGDAPQGARSPFSGISPVKE